jgi:aminoglycoside phosphotransferase (APT) family kinase protein
MGRVTGEALGQRLVRDEKYAAARKRLAGQCGEVLARIHSIDTARLPRLPELPIRTSIDMYRNIIDDFGEPQPVFELALRWLEANMPPPPEKLALVHGDFRTGNFLADETGMTAVLDWEIAHLGDPMEDLGWFCVPSWRYGAVDKPAGGFGSREELISAYERESGRTIDRDTFRFWEVFGTFRWGVICQMQAFTHLRGINRSVELCAIGRRSTETEVDLLLEIGGEE